MAQTTQASLAHAQQRSSSRGYWLTNVGLACMLATISVVGCHGSTSNSDAATREPCNLDGDCKGGKICKATSDPGLHTQRMAPCPYTTCTTSATCPTGQVCVPANQIGTYSHLCSSVSMACGPSCQTAGCTNGYTCQSDGTCRLMKCDEQGAAACPDSFTCNPTAAMTEPTTNQGSAVPDDYVAITRGCIRKRCDVSGGFTCRPQWTCQPSVATDASGCVPIPCTASGHCSDDSSYICKPSNSYPRPTSTDPQGCVFRNCYEGVTCSFLVNGKDVGYCDSSGPFASAFGCAAKRCLDSDGICPLAYRCESVSSGTDARGCRAPQCYTAGCSTGMLCNPLDKGADANGCIQVVTATGGATGAGGAPSIGGSTQVGSAGAGASSGTSHTVVSTGAASSTAAGGSDFGTSSLVLTTGVGSMGTTVGSGAASNTSTTRAGSGGTKGSGGANTELPASGGKHESSTGASATGTGSTTSSTSEWLGECVSS